MGRTRQPKMTRERVLDGALALVDRDGIAGLSMRKLGAELGIEAMTLYYYFPNKEAILDGLIEQIVLQVSTLLIGEPKEWTSWLRTLAVALRQELLRHPRLLTLVATRPVMTSSSLHMVEQIVAALCVAGFTPLRAFQVLNTITTFVVGHTLAEAGDTPGHEDAMSDTNELADQLDPSQFPYFTEAIKEGLGQPNEHQARFEFALDAIFIGLKHLQP